MHLPGAGIQRRRTAIDVEENPVPEADRRRGIRIVEGNGEALRRGRGAGPRQIGRFIVAGTAHIAKDGALRNRVALSKERAGYGERRCRCGIHLRLDTQFALVSEG